MPHFGVHFGGVPHEKVFDTHAQVCGWAPVVVHRKASLKTISQLARTLKAGGVVCMSADYCRPAMRQNGPEGNDRGERQTMIGVTLGGRRISVENFVGWLAATTGAMVLPATSHRTSRGRYTVELQPALDLGNPGKLSSRDFASAVTRSVVAALDADVAANPLQWAFLGVIAESPITSA
jgi:lauroyl/myristoyl acyltransferase